MPEPHTVLMKGLATLLQTGQFSDLKIICGDRHFAVHKSIICCQSKPLMAMCTNGMKESQENVIDLTIDTEPCVSRLINFFYRCDYSMLEIDSEAASSPDENDSVNKYTRFLGHELLLHVDMYVLADKYGIVPLRKLAKERFEGVARGLSPFWENRPSSVFPVLEIIPRVYSVTGEHNRDLRDVVVRYTRLQRTLTHSGLFSEKVRELFESIPEFAVDVSQSWLELPYLSYCRVAGCWEILEKTGVICKSCED